jgi:hypothetical protein
MTLHMLFYLFCLVGLALFHDSKISGNEFIMVGKPLLGVSFMSMVCNYVYVLKKPTNELHHWSVFHCSNKCSFSLSCVFQACETFCSRGSMVLECHPKHLRTFIYYN